MANRKSARTKAKVKPSAMTEADTKLAVGKIKRWPGEDRREWRALLEIAPQEAALIAELSVRLSATPVRGLDG